MLGAEEIEQVSSFKYLGVQLDSMLKFNDHVDMIRKKVYVRTRILWKLRPYISQDLAKELCIYLIDPLVL